MSLPRNRKSIRYYCFQLLGSHGRRQVVAWFLKHKNRASPVVFPGNNAQIKKMLLIAPLQPLDALLQVPTVMALCNRFRSGEIWVLCTAAITPLFKTIDGVKQIIEYTAEDRWLFTTGCRGIRSQIIREQFDSCLLLERQPDEALLFWCGSSGARMRCGYHGVAQFPFVNLQAKASDSSQYLLRTNRLLAEILGCPKSKSESWVVAKPQLAEMRHLLGEYNLSPEKKLIGIDVGYLRGLFSTPWIEELLGNVRQTAAQFEGAAVYLFSNQSADKEANALITAAGLPCIANLAIAQTAALVASTAVVVGGKSLMFVMAALLKRPAIGIVSEEERPLFCDSAAHVHPVVYRSRTDDSVSRGVSTVLAGLI